MISHKHKCIFIHIPKTAGMSITSFFHPGVHLHHTIPNYEILFGWCPKRRLHMQHATAEQLIETELISIKNWEEYFKFSFIRNPWDRSYSDYLWIKNFTGIKDSFKNYILKKGKFKVIFSNRSDSNFLGDHLYPQSNFFSSKGILKPDFIGRFENFQSDIQYVLEVLDIEEKFANKINTSSKRFDHYSHFYTNFRKELVCKLYKEDIQNFDYQFEDSRSGVFYLKKIFSF